MKKIFLLGGYDLEMLAIKNMLQENDIEYFDKELSWCNATLDQYSTILEKYGAYSDYMIYGIELRISKKDRLPQNYNDIDHHNNLNTLPSSLEQVAEILQISLTREQLLIAANDKGYIPAMQQLGARKDEIDEIRRRDREAQGVRKEDELLAEKAIENKFTENGIIVIQSETNRFSPITDRIFPYDKLLIYTDEELMYYGKGKKRLTEIFAEEIKSGKMFHGGNDEGYFGVAQGMYSKNEIEKFKTEIIQKI